MSRDEYTSVEYCFWRDKVNKHKFSIISNTLKYCVKDSKLLLLHIFYKVFDNVSMTMVTNYGGITIAQ